MSACSKWFKKHMDFPSTVGILSDASIDNSFQESEFQVFKTASQTSYIILCPLNCSLEILKQFSHFCYDGKFEDTFAENCTAHQQAEFLLMCTLMEFDLGKQEAVKLLCNNFDVGDFLFIIDLTEKHDLPQVKNTCWRKLCLQFSDFLDKKDFLKMDRSYLDDMCLQFKIHSKDILELGDEQLNTALFRWAESDAEKCKFVMPLINKHIDFTSCSYDYLANSLPGFEKPMESLQASGGLKKRYEEALEKAKKKLNDSSSKKITKLNQSKLGSLEDLNMKGLFISSGGRLFDTFHAQVMHLDLNTGKWREITRLPLALAHHQTVMSRNSRHAIGTDRQSYSYFVVGGTHSAHTGSIPNNTCSGNSVPTGPATVQALRLDLIVSSDKSDLNEKWENLPDLQQPRSHLSLDLLGTNTLVAIGGRHSMTIRNTCEILNLGESKGRHMWQFIAPLKQARHSHASCSYGDTVYISGGTSNKGVPLNDLLCIRPNDRNVCWTTLKPMLSSRSEHCMIKANSNQILVLGGTTGNLQTEGGTKNNKSDTENSNTSKKYPETENSNKNTANTSFNNSNSSPSSSPRNTSSPITVDSYNPMNDYWSRLQNNEGENIKISDSSTEHDRINNKNRRVAHKLPNISTPKMQPGASDLAQASAAVFWSGKIMVLGGWNAGKLGRFDHNDRLWMYDPKSGRWEQAGGIPSKLRAASLSCFFNTKNV